MDGGEFDRYGKLHGKGKMTRMQGGNLMVYTVELNANVPHGAGVLVGPEQTIECDDWVSGAPNGLAKVVRGEGIALCKFVDGQPTAVTQCGDEPSKTAALATRQHEDSNPHLKVTVR